MLPVSCMVVVVFSGGGPSACCVRRVLCRLPVSSLPAVCCDLFHGVEQVLCVCFRPLHEKTVVGVLGVS